MTEEQAVKKIFNDMKKEIIKAINDFPNWRILDYYNWICEKNVNSYEINDRALKMSD